MTRSLRPVSLSIKDVHSCEGEGEIGGSRDHLAQDVVHAVFYVYGTGQGAKDMMAAGRTWGWKSKSSKVPGAVKVGLMSTCSKPSAVYKQADQSHGHCRATP